MSGWWNVRMEAEQAPGNPDAPEGVNAAMAALIGSADGTLLKEARFRDIVIEGDGAWRSFSLSVEAPHISAAWITALITLNRTAAVAGFPPWPMTALTITSRPAP